MLLEAKVAETRLPELATLNIVIDGARTLANQGERLIDVINRSGAKLAQVCYHPQLGPIQTCDTCMVEVEGRWSAPVRRRYRPGWRS